MHGVTPDDSRRVRGARVSESVTRFTSHRRGRHTAFVVPPSGGMGHPRRMPLHSRRGGYYERRSAPVSREQARHALGKFVLDFLQIYRHNEADSLTSP